MEQLTLKEAAEYLGMKVDALRYLCTRTTKSPEHILSPSGKPLFLKANLDYWQACQWKEKIRKGGIPIDHEMMLRSKLLSLSMKEFSDSVCTGLCVPPEWKKLADVVSANADKIQSYAERLCG